MQIYKTVLFLLLLELPPNIVIYLMNTSFQMEVLTLNRKLLQILGMCLDDETASRKQRIVSKLINWTILTISIFMIAISFEYIVSHFEDTESILYAVIQMSANTASGGGYWTSFKKKYQISQFFDKIENLVNARKSDVSFSKLSILLILLTNQRCS